MTDTKRCRKCGRDLPLDQFPYCTSTYKGQKKKYRSSPCRDCHNLANLIWHERTLETRRAARTAYMREWRAKNPHYLIYQNRLRRKRRLARALEQPQAHVRIAR